MMQLIIGYLGQKILRAAGYISNLVTFTYQLLLVTLTISPLKNALVRRVLVEQIFFTAVQALTIIIPIALIIGCMTIIQFSLISSQYDLGKTIVLLIVRELGPIVTALLVILRSATAITIEMGYMRLFHEIDALEMNGIDPMEVVCLPRLVGITLSILSLFIMFDLVSILGGFFFVGILTDIFIKNLLFQIAKAISGTDIVVGILKALCFGIIITVTSTYRGLNIQHQVTEIPLAASKTAVECFLYCLIANIGISVLFYL